MRRDKTIILPLLFLFIFLFSCRKDERLAKYERPDWLAGKLYTQILAQPDLSTFAKCIALCGYDSVINISGVYTVFAPSNQALDGWLAQHPTYNTVESIPIPELTRMVKYHIVQDPWSKAQLRSLDVFGWIDYLDENNNKPKGYKRESLLKEKDRKFGYKQLYGVGNAITDTLQTPFHRRVITDSRKYVPIFYQEYFNINDLTSADYEFYFNRSFDGENHINVAGGKILGDEIFAENGFIYTIDRVLEPLRSAYQIMESKNNEDDYSQFLNLINSFPQFQYNQVRTFDQEGADQGIAVDSLFDLTFPGLTFNPVNERTQAPKGTQGLPQNVTIRYHHGLLVPSNSAFENLINNYINIPNGWGSLDGAPQKIRSIIANTHMSINGVYPSDLKNGFYNGEQDMVRIDENNILQKEYGSNSTFIGLKEAIVPRAFSSVTGAVYLQRGYSKIMSAIEESTLLPLLKRENKNYMFFVESDFNTSEDSSLIYDPITRRFSVYEISLIGGLFTKYNLSKTDLRTLLLNHITEQNPKGIARKEFIPNLAGNYLIINNQTGEISGTTNTTVGYNGSEIVSEFPRVLSEANNGKTFEINNWFSFGSPTIFGRISTQFPAFHALLIKAGFAVVKEARYNFITNSEFYTVFAPSQAAIESAGLNSLPVDQLKKVLLLHFVQGQLLFTDGNKNAGYYETARVDEKSTPFTTIYSKLFIEPGIDQIRFKDKDGAVYGAINESEVTNLLTGINLGVGTEVFPNIFNNAVIHEIDKLLIFEELDTQ